MTTTVSEYRPQADDLQRELETARRRIAQLETEVMQAQAEAERAAIESHLRIAALEAGSTQEPTSGSDVGPLEDVVRRAMIDENWKIDSQGRSYRPRQDGLYDYTPPSTWMKKFRETMPPYFPKYQGSDATGTSGASNPVGTGPNPWTREAWNVTKQSEYILKEGMAKAEAMATAAGSTVHATHPPKGV